MGSSKINIHLKHLIENFRRIKAGNSKALICGAVKANAYGHGIVQVSKILEEEGCDYLAVARTYEVNEIKNSGVSLPILVLTLQTPQELKTLIDPQIELIVTTVEYAKTVSEEAVKKGIVINLHLKIDTGMGRVGCPPDQAVSIAKELKKMKGVYLKGVATHFATSDCDEEDFNRSQIMNFQRAIEDIKSAGIEIPIIHSYNSGAILNFKEAESKTMVRAGLLLYGYYPSSLRKGQDIMVNPVMELESTVVGLKKLAKGSSISYGRTYITGEDEFIANIPIGYADGYPRSLSNRGEVIINNRIYPVVGTICMDQLLVRVDSSVKLYDRVKLLSIKGEPNADSIAKLTGTISYEILTNLKRVEKHYIK